MTQVMESMHNPLPPFHITSVAHALYLTGVTPYKRWKHLAK